VKEEPAASDGPPPAGVGSSDSDSSGVLNDTDATGATPAPPEAPAPDAVTTLLGGPGAAAVAGNAFFHGSFPKLEEDETGFLDDEGPCGGFFDDEPPLAWWTEPAEPWK
jgi:homeobox-leucine zipper protein